MARWISSENPWAVASFSLTLLAASACKSRDPSVLETPVKAKVTVADGGGPELAIGDEPRTLVPLSADDKGPFSLESDDKGTRIAVRSGAGPWKIVYVGTEKRAFLAPETRASVDWSKTPTFVDAAATIFVAAPSERRGDVVAQARADGGDSAVAKLLARGAEVSDPLWDKTYAALPADKQAEVQSGLRALVKDKDGPRGAIARALVVTGGIEPEAAATRFQQMARQGQLDAPRGLGMLLRIAARSQDVGESACRILGKVKPEDDDKRVLVDAALLAVAKRETKCADVAQLLLDNRCAASLRCGASGPLSPRDTSKQDEPLCDKASTAKTVDAELARAPKDVDTMRALTAHFALAAAYAQGDLPEALVRAHARRTFKLTQADKPECDTGLDVGAACHCDEAAVRDQACRNDGPTFSFGFCKVDVDDAKKTITKVSFTPPP